jgi:hypothetical protein
MRQIDDKDFEEFIKFKRMQTALREKDTYDACLYELGLLIQKYFAQGYILRVRNGAFELIKNNPESKNLEPKNLEPKSQETKHRNSSNIKNLDSKSQEELSSKSQGSKNIETTIGSLRL